MKNLLEQRDDAIKRINAMRSSGIGLNAIAEKLGNKKQYQSWLSRFSRGGIANPGIETLQSVIDALDELELSGKLEPRADSVGQGDSSTQDEVFYGVDKRMSPVYQQVTLDKPRVLGRFVGRDQEQMNIGGMA